MPRPATSVAWVTARRAVAIPLAILLAAAPMPSSEPSSQAEASAAGPPTVEQFEDIVMLGEFAAPGFDLDHIVMAWDEIIDPRFVPDGTDFTITIDGDDHPADGVELLYAGVASDSFPFGDDGVSFMRLDLPDGVTVSDGDTVTLDYTPGTTPVLDLALNPAAAFTNATGFVIDSGGFGQLLTVVDGYHGADKVVIVLTDPVEPLSLPDPTQFTVEVDNVPVAVNDVTDLAPEVGLAFIELTLVSAVTDPASSVVVNYTSEPGTLVSRYRGETLGDLLDVPATVILTSNAKADTLAVGGELSTAAPGGPTPGDPVGTTVRAASGGATSITEGSVDFPSPPGFAFFGHQVVVEVPDAPSAANPNVLQFEIDASIVPQGQNHLTIQVFRNGVLVPGCTGAPAAVPTPCVSERVPLAGGDVGLTVLTVQASTWNLAIGLPYDFSGFLLPVRNPPRVNLAAAGWVIPIRFSLGGDRGLDIFADGSPTSKQVPCPSHAPSSSVGASEPTNAFGLHYNSRTDRYLYFWRTSRSWAGTCREFSITFADGTVATALFRFLR